MFSCETRVLPKVSILSGGSLSGCVKTTVKLVGNPIAGNCPGNGSLHVLSILDKPKISVSVFGVAELGLECWGREMWRLNYKGSF